MPHKCTLSCRKDHTSVHKLTKHEKHSETFLNTLGESQNIVPVLQRGRGKINYKKRGEGDILMLQGRGERERRASLRACAQDGDKHFGIVYVPLPSV